MTVIASQDRNPTGWQVWRKDLRGQIETEKRHRERERERDLGDLRKIQKRTSGWEQKSKRDSHVVCHRLSLTKLYCVGNGELVVQG